MPKNRNMFIKLAFGLNYDVKQTNKLLTRYGKYSELYAKDINDAIIIYVLNNRMKNTTDEKYSYANLKKWHDKFNDIRKNYVPEEDAGFQYKTIGVYTSIISIEDDERFEKYIYENKKIFLNSYKSLYNYISDFIRIRTQELEDVFDSDPGNRYSWHRIVVEKGLDKTYEKMLSDLKNHGILPKREQLIGLGIHLNMVETDINNMLTLAHMEELCARDKLESLLLYILRNAVMSDPDLELNNAYKYLGIASDKQFKQKYEKIIERYFRSDDTEEWDMYIEDLSDYIRKQFADVNMGDMIDRIL